ncbi:3-deoxy-D-manno-octulosonic acid transferase [Maribacter thermophilus]|uniref:3-deoxy-D-manno-octulosonic acid transferase n=1 Tax=Maribacter thermophilus TaxID=1197874 RepID=UPI00064148AA|nr:glycosyltransferase N-terminal domain-containing protein [Maribacter thermophilus]
MHSFYNIIVSIAWQFLKLIGLLNPKISLFVEGRKNTFDTLREHISPNDKIIWIHAASLGEYEQGLPVLEKLKREYPNHKTLLTFFSPSGYEVKKNSSPADITTYLPFDVKKNVIRFLDMVQPKLVIFIKYEIWPNYLTEIGKRDIPAILISARFKKDKIFFKSYGGFMRKALSNFSFIYVQDNHSKRLLNSININSVKIAGDTRLDRVSEILKQDNTLNFMDQFCQDTLCFIAGSTWPEDEKVLVDYINESTSKIKYVIAPHNIKPDHITSLKAAIEKSTLLYSELPKSIASETQVIIVDTIGLLTKIYSYGDIAYVGGGFATGLHNTLEPAVYGIPVIIGPRYKGFLEAEDLIELGGLLSISNKNEFFKITDKLIAEETMRKEIGQINTKYIIDNKGASIQIIKDIRTLL